MLPNSNDYVIGVDTHAERHSLCLVEAHAGRILLERELPATAPAIGRRSNWCAGAPRAGGSGRSRAPAPPAPGLLAFWLLAESPCARSSDRRAAAVQEGSSRTPSMPSERPALPSPAGSSRTRVQGPSGRPCVSCCARGRGRSRPGALVSTSFGHSW